MFPADTRFASPLRDDGLPKLAWTAAFAAMTSFGILMLSFRDGRAGGQLRKSIPGSTFQFLRDVRGAKAHLADF